MAIKNKSKRYDTAVKDAYIMLVNYRRVVEDRHIKGPTSEEIREVCKALWLEALNEPPPW